MITTNYHSQNLNQVSEPGDSHKHSNKHSIHFLLNPENNSPAENNNSLKRKYSNAWENRDRSLFSKFNKITFETPSNPNEGIFNWDSRATERNLEINKTAQRHLSWITTPHNTPTVEQIRCKSRKWTSEMEDELKGLYEKYQGRRKDCVNEFQKNHRELTQEGIRQKLAHLLPKVKSNKSWTRWTVEMKEELTELYKQCPDSKSCVEAFQRNHKGLSYSAINNKIQKIKTKNHLFSEPTIIGNYEHNK